MSRASSQSKWKRQLISLPLFLFKAMLVRSSFYHILPADKRKWSYFKPNENRVQRQHQALGCHAVKPVLSNTGSKIDDSQKHKANTRKVSPAIGTTNDDVFVLSRRRFWGVATTMVASILPTSAYANNPARDGNAEVDHGSGLSFVPKRLMLGGGGSDATRGIAHHEGKPSHHHHDRTLNSRLPLQTVYEPRFIAYLTRFLLNFEPAARGWWVDQDLEEFTWERSRLTSDADHLRQFKFAELCESVEVGLADYFVGRYSSVLTSWPDQSTTPSSHLSPSSRNSGAADSEWNHFIQARFQYGRTSNNKINKRGANMDNTNSTWWSGQDLGVAKEGVLNLMALLKARYTTTAAKRQLAILFSLISSPDLQPTAEIQSILGEADNATITRLEMTRTQQTLQEKMISRFSSQHGGGYSLDQPPVIAIDPPPALGNSYTPAKAIPLLQTTSRILRIEVTDPGEGYSQPPNVQLIGRCQRPCKACALLDRQGHVEEIVVLDPGFGYTEADFLIKIDPPINPQEKNGRNVRKREKSIPALLSVSRRRNDRTARRRHQMAIGPVREATASAILEYELVGIELVQGGTGYVAFEPPRVKIWPPEQEPDWYLAPQAVSDLATPLQIDSPEVGVHAKVTEMRFPDGSDTLSSGENLSRVDISLIARLQREPLELLPPSIRPQLVPFAGSASNCHYTIPSLPPSSASAVPSSPRFRALDPIFGGVGTVPVTKDARSLTASEYARLALSGALCTVLVRTALNPLELIKTKLQLGNDLELTDYHEKSNSALIQQSARVESNQLGKKNKIPSSSTVAGLLQKHNRKEVSTRSEAFLDLNAETFGTAIKVTGRQGQETASRATTIASRPSQDLLDGASKNSSGTTHAVWEAESLMPLPITSTATLGSVGLIFRLSKLRGVGALFQSADITFLASLVFGSIGFGATELFRRLLMTALLPDGSGGGSSVTHEIVLLLAAGVAAIITSAAATPFEMLRVRSMGMVKPQPWLQVLRDVVKEHDVEWDKNITTSLPQQSDSMGNSCSVKDALAMMPLWAGFTSIVLRELPFAVTKFLCFDILANAIASLINLHAVGEDEALPVQVGVGTVGLAVSAVAGALAGVAGAVVSHPADLILTYTSVQRRSKTGETPSAVDWKNIVQELVARDGGAANLFVGLPVRAMFFFLVIGLQFFLYDFVKNLLHVGSDDLTLVLDIFNAVRAGLPVVDQVMGEGT